MTKAIKTITECGIMYARDVANNRYICCGKYDDCLSMAIKKNMLGFHCKNCNTYLKRNIK